MIRAEQIPDEVAWKLHDKLWKVGGPSVDEVRASIAAALNAWPGMQHKPYWDFRTNEKHTELILPVPQKEKGGQ